LNYFAYHIVQEREVANDIVQEAFEKLWKVKVIDLPDQKPILGFLYATVKNASLNYLKKEKVKERYMNYMCFN